MKSKRAIVSGATGFVGSHLCRHLLAEGWEIFAPVRQAASLSQYWDDSWTGISFFDCCGKPEALVDWVAQTNADVLFHLAASFIAEHKVADIPNLIRSNLELGSLLLEGHQHSDRKLVVNVGTSWQHYHDEIYSPVCLYAATKEAFEKILAYYIEAGGIHAVTLTLFDTYGEKDFRPKLINLLHNFAKEQTALNLSPGEQQLDLVYIEDVVSAFVAAYEHLQAFPDIRHASYGVSSNERISLRELVALFEEISGTKLNVNWGGRPYRKREVMEPWKEFQRLPNWTPKTPLRIGLWRLFVNDTEGNGFGTTPTSS